MRIKRKCTYKLWDVICVVFIATLCNCNDWEEIEIFARKNKEWFKIFLKLTGGICPAVTYKNIMSTVNAEELNNFCLYAYEELIEKARKNRDMYHFDGKVDRHSGRKVNFLPCFIRYCIFRFSTTISMLNGFYAVFFYLLLNLF